MIIHPCLPHSFVHLPFDWVNLMDHDTFLCDFICSLWNWSVFILYRLCLYFCHFQFFVAVYYQFYCCIQILCQTLVDIFNVFLETALEDTVTQYVVN